MLGRERCTMAFLPIDQTLELCQFALKSDMGARGDLAGGYLRDENDYTSNFTGALRREINSSSRTGLQASSYLLSTSVERRTGCDAIIAIQSGHEVKILLLEAKFPRLQTPSYQWDSTQRNSKISHFSDQLVRQSSYAKLWAIFEMFYCEWPIFQQPQYMDNLGSSCVWHTTASSFDSVRTSRPGIWSQTDVIGLLSKEHLSIGEILLDVCLCNMGQRIQMPSHPKYFAEEYQTDVLFISGERNHPG
jgi:hypothetical protein